MSRRNGTLQQLTKYLDMELSEGDDDCLPFSQCNAVGLNKLFLPTLHALSALVPALQLKVFSAIKIVSSCRGNSMDGYC